jgi:hypothetical protein
LSAAEAVTARQQQATVNSHFTKVQKSIAVSLELNEFSISIPLHSGQLTSGAMPIASAFWGCLLGGQSWQTAGCSRRRDGLIMASADGRANTERRQPGKSLLERGLPWHAK